LKTTFQETRLNFRSRLSRSDNWICGIKKAWKPKIHL